MFFYDIVLSFAGEDREYVEKIAFLLKMRGIKVFYDKYETGNLWGKDLYQYLSDIYKNRAQYCIVFISKHYIEKNWTKLELKSAQEKSFLQDEEYILPIILESNIKIPGISVTTGFLDASQYTEKEIVDFIEEKLGIKINKDLIYNEIIEYLQMMIIAYCNIENKESERKFFEYKDRLKTYLLKKAFVINGELYDFYLSIIEEIEERYKFELTQKEFRISIKHAYLLFSKANYIIVLTDIYKNNDYNDEIDFYDLADEFNLYDKIEIVEETVKQFLYVICHGDCKPKLIFWDNDENGNELYYYIKVNENEIEYTEVTYDRPQ